MFFRNKTLPTAKIYITLSLSLSETTPTFSLSLPILIFFFSIPNSAIIILSPKIPPLEHERAVHVSIKRSTAPATAKLASHFLAGAALQIFWNQHASQLTRNRTFFTSIILPATACICKSRILFFILNKIIFFLFFLYHMVCDWLMQKKLITFFLRKISID